MILPGRLWLIALPSIELVELDANSVRSCHRTNHPQRKALHGRVSRSGGHYLEQQDSVARWNVEDSVAPAGGSAGGQRDDHHRS